MAKFYFDIKDGVPVRDRTGVELSDRSAAVQYSKELAAKKRVQVPAGRHDLYIAVVDESGREVHRELIYTSS